MASAGFSSGRPGSACSRDGSGDELVSAESLLQPEVKEKTGSPSSASVSTSGGSGPKEAVVERKRAVGVGHRNVVLTDLAVAASKKAGRRDRGARVANVAKSRLYGPDDDEGDDGIEVAALGKLDLVSRRGRRRRRPRVMFISMGTKKSSTV